MSRQAKIDAIMDTNPARRNQEMVGMTRYDIALRLESTFWAEKRLIPHPTANKKRAKEQFDDLVLPWLPPEFKHNASLIIAEYYCTGSVFPEPFRHIPQPSRGKLPYGRHGDGKGPSPRTEQDPWAPWHWRSNSDPAVVLCAACRVESK